MNAFAIISEWLPGAAGLREKLVLAEADLRAWAVKFPDAAEFFIARADDIAKQIAELDAATTPEGIVNLAAIAVAELKNLAVTRTLDPRPHPSDLA